MGYTHQRQHGFRRSWRYRRRLITPCGWPRVRITDATAPEFVGFTWTLCIDTTPQPQYLGVMRHHIEAKISEGRQKCRALKDQIDRLHRDHEIASAELRAYEDVLAHMPAEAASSRRAPSGKRGGRSRSLSETWRKIIGAVGSRYPETVNSAGLYKMVAAIAPDMKEDSIRSQVAALVKKGVIERVSPGVFRVSPDQEREAGAVRPNEEDMASDVLGASTPNENEASSDASEAETAERAGPAVSNPFNPPDEA